jgi:D-alanyl-D-alanine carboxypeptidase
MRSLKRSALFTMVAVAIIAILNASPPYHEGLASVSSGSRIPEDTTSGSRAAAPTSPDPGPVSEGRTLSKLHQTIAFDDAGIAVVTNPASPEVVINKERALPEGYAPHDLVYPDVAFSFRERIEKRMLRREAAEALERLFAAAAADNIMLVGISGYRSYATQRAIFARQVRNRGEREAARVSAYPGRSEHQTGWAIDVSSASVGYALDASFGDSREGRWLAANAARFGFIIRYPEGMEWRTGYIYEPWHIRYVGIENAREIAARGITLEDLFEGPVRVDQGGELGEDGG